MRESVCCPIELILIGLNIIKYSMCIKKQFFHLNRKKFHPGNWVE